MGQASSTLTELITGLNSVEVARSKNNLDCMVRRGTTDKYPDGTLEL